MVETVKLKQAIEFGEEVITELEFKAPTLGDLKKLDGVKGEMAKLCTLISLCTELDPVQAEMIGSIDLEAISEALGKFMPSDPKTGAT
jgi:hypothetical protein